MPVVQKDAHAVKIKRHLIKCPAGKNIAIAAHTDEGRIAFFACHTFGGGITVTEKKDIIQVLLQSKHPTEAGFVSVKIRKNE